MSIDRIQFVGHSCFWATLDDRHFIVDTNFSKKILGFVKRHGSVGIDLDNLPDISASLVTHAHYDHLDIFSYKYFPQDKPIITPPDFGKFINRFIHNPVVELKTWTDHEISPVKIIAVPAQHTGFRLSGIRYTKCNGYILQGSKHIFYFAGDTAYGPHLKTIGNAFPIDAACLPIGPVSPKWLMKYRHLDPQSSLQAFQDLKAKTMIPTHWGAFRLGLDRVDETIKTFKEITQDKPIASSIKILQPGQCLTFEG